MNLTPEQQALLNGEKGEMMAKVMKTLVMYGNTFGAERMVPVTSEYGHTVISYGLAALKPVYDLFDRLIDAGLTILSNLIRGAVKEGAQVISGEEVF